MVAKKSKILSLDLKALNDRELTRILEKVEEKVKEYLSETLPPRSEYDLVLTIENTGNEIVFSVDIGLKGSYTDIINYDRIINDAINIARKELENELVKYRQVKK